MFCDFLEPQHVSQQLLEYNESKILGRVAEASQPCHPRALDDLERRQKELDQLDAFLASQRGKLPRTADRLSPAVAPSPLRHPVSSLGPNFCAIV